MTDQDWQRKKEDERLRRLKGIRPFVDNKLKAHTLRLAEFRAKNRTKNLQKHANGWKLKHEKARLVRLGQISGTVDQRLHPSSKHFMERHHRKQELNPMGSHSARLAKKNEKVRLKRLARCLSQSVSRRLAGDRRPSFDLIVDVDSDWAGGARCAQLCITGSMY